MKGILLAYLLIGLQLVMHGNSANVLLLAHLQGSHVAQLTTIGIEMASRGHEVYIILPETSKFISLKKKGINVLTFRANKEDVFFESDYYSDQVAEYITINGYYLAHFYLLTAEVTKRHCQLMLEDVNLMEQVKKIHFDVALIDAFGLNFCLYLLPNILSVPTVSLSATFSPWQIGIPAFPSFVSHPLFMTSDKLSLREKLQAAFMHILLTSNYFPLRFDTELLQKYGKGIQTWNELIYQSMLFIQFRDEILEWPTPKMPNVIYLPGITYSATQNLPQHISNVYQHQNIGVIIVSFGSTAGYLTYETLHKFLTVFDMMKEYDVIWKFPLDKLDNKLKIPSNVHMLDWLPQNDCLGHNKTVLFITHCGNNGQYESLYHGVPMLGFPLVADQPHNALRIQAKGFGLYLDIKEFTMAELEVTINHILNNETIKQNVQMFSRMLKERQHPKEEAIYWIEHILKFGGSDIRGASMDMPMYELLMVDIIVFLLIIMFIIFSCCLFICKYICCRKNSKPETE